MRTSATVSMFGVGAVGVFACFARLADHTVNVVNYRIAPLRVPGAAGPVEGLARSLVVPVACAGLVALGAVFTWRSPESSRPFKASGRFLFAGGCAGFLMAVGIPDWAATRAEDAGRVTAWFVRVLPFSLFCTMAVGVGCASGALCGPVFVSLGRRVRDRWALTLLVGLIVFTTIWHALQQTVYWQHFLLGYADFGFFATELEHCLPWKRVGELRFFDTRMGYHFIPMFYVLVPVYAFFRSPVFLMFIGPLVLALPANAFYQAARQRSGSVIVGLLVGVAWLSLPSVSRLPYSNSYGFQSIYLAAPWLAWCFSFAVRGFWARSHACLAGAVLCEETVCGVAFGWGLYLWLFRRRREGPLICAVSIIYLLLATLVIIPAFASSATYTRVELFGDLSAATLLNRLGRPQAVLYLLALGAPLIVGLVRAPKWLIVIAPTLLLVLLLQQRDYLNIKYWHQTTILVGLFAAATVGVTRADGTAASTAATGRAAALLVTVLLFHQFLGRSPLTQAYRLHAANPHLQDPDPRMEAVRYVHATFAPHRFIAVATKRMAAHFIQYRMVHPAPQPGDSLSPSTPQVLIVDTGDTWHRAASLPRTHSAVSDALSKGFRLVYRLDYTLPYASGAVLVLTNKPGRVDDASVGRAAGPRLSAGREP